MRDDGMSINVRLKTELLASLDRWIDGLSGATLSCVEAIRRILAEALAGKAKRS